MSEETKKTFHESVGPLLETVLLKYKEKDLNKETCIEIYATLFETLTGLFEQTKMPLGNEAANYMVQQYYDGVLINGRQELDPSIFTQRAKVENIPTKELALLAVMFTGTEFRIDVMSEIKRRS
jgi:hypothetical protein